MACASNKPLDLYGYMPSLPTPFDASGNIDRPAFERLCERQVENGATALVVADITGEAPTLSPTEHRVLVYIALEIASGRIPVIAGAGSNSTEHAVELTRDAERIGADGILSVVPYYNKPSQIGIIAHFNAIRRSTGLPIILHDAPARCGTALADATIVQLSAMSQQFAGLMDSSADVGRPARLRPLVEPGFRLLSGHDATAFAFLALGGDGCISVTSNITPRLCRQMYVDLKHGHIDRAQRFAAPIARLSQELAMDADPVPLKCILSVLGLMAPTVRLPLVEMAPAAARHLADSVAEIGYECAGGSALDTVFGQLAYRGRHTTIAAAE